VHQLEGVSTGHLCWASGTLLCVLTLPSHLLCRAFAYFVPLYSFTGLTLLASLHLPAFWLLDPILTPSLAPLICPSCLLSYVSWVPRAGTLPSMQLVVSIDLSALTEPLPWLMLFLRLALYALSPNTRSFSVQVRIVLLI
jgi:hypothetical protein